ncbi:hypothetical protein HKI87_16g82640 [Chloropicon roscoffensis]|uniref:Uncharacterized protein n=1 Tax=Chloropicon roscoffensis TaxID=1461544 RepID=A0AAX4PM58_9CHLO
MPASASPMEKVTVVPGMSPFLQRTRSLKGAPAGGDAESDAGSEGSGKFNKVIRDAETNVARLAGVMQNAELELEKAFNRQGALQKDYAGKLEAQLDELKGILGSKQAQITFLEEKVENLKESYGEKLSKSQARVTALEQEQRRYKHSHAMERERVSETLQRDLGALNVQVGHLRKSKAGLEKRCEDLTVENAVMKKKLQDASRGSVFEFDVTRVSKLEKEVREGKDALDLERARNQKLQKKIKRLEEEAREAETRRDERYRNFAEMKVPYKEQLRKENEALRASILGGSADQAGGSKDDVHFAWMHRVLNSGRNFEGSVCGNSWSSDYRPMFFESF